MGHHGHGQTGDEAQGHTCMYLHAQKLHHPHSTTTWRTSVGWVELHVVVRRVVGQHKCVGPHAGPQRRHLGVHLRGQGVVHHAPRHSLHVSREKKGERGRGRRWRGWRRGGRGGGGGGGEGGNTRKFKIMQPQKSPSSARLRVVTHTHAHTHARTRTHTHDTHVLRWRGLIVPVRRRPQHPVRCAIRVDAAHKVVSTRCEKRCQPCHVTSCRGRRDK
jgi:hypothetical protein